VEDLVCLRGEVTDCNRLNTPPYAPRFPRPPENYSDLKVTEKRVIGSPQSQCLVCPFRATVETWMLRSRSLCRYEVTSSAYSIILKISS